MRSQGAQSGQGGVASFALVGAALALSLALSIRRLTGTPYAIDFCAAWTGLKTVAGATLPAALRIWSFWILAAAAVTAALLRIDRAIGWSDALLGGAAGAWACAYLLGNLLGPIGLFRPFTIWLFVIALGAWGLLGGPRVTLSRLSAGQRLAFLALALLLVGLLPLELASPVVPFMDVLSYPASVQRIISFRHYLPFDNDPYGCWGPQAQTPGWELFLAMLAMGGGAKLGVLAQSGAMVPMGALMVFSTWRLGAATVGDAAGGAAALLLFFTNTFRRMVGMRGTAVALALVALGLAFVLDRGSRRTTVALGSFLLGTAVASHAIEGGLAIAAGGCALIWQVDADPKPMFLKIACLAGAVLVAAPEFAIATRTVVPYPLLPLIQIVGAALIIVCARALPDPKEARGCSRSRYVILAALFALALVYVNATVPGCVFAQVFRQFPILSAFSAVGLAAVAASRGADGEIEGSPIIFALLITIVVEALTRGLESTGGAGAYAAGLADIHHKLDEYWTPYFLVFLGGAAFGLIYERAWRPFVSALLVLILVYPWNPRHHSSYDYQEHSIAENWAIDLRTAGSGYWFSTPDARWTVGPSELALIELLKQERDAGRITMKTHILHIAHDVIVWHAFNRFSVFTGINDDPIVFQIPASDVGWLAGSRVRMISALPEALAQNPPYILIQVPPPAGLKIPPDSYETIFNRGDLQLFRRRGLAASR